MNLMDMRIQAQLHIGVSIDQPFARRYANECLLQLCNMYPRTAMRKKKLLLENVTRGEEVAIPDDCYMLYKVKTHGELYDDYEMFEDHLEFEDSGNFEITYFAKPTPLNAETDVPEVPEAFHPSICLFIGAREKFRLFGEEDVDSIRLMREFAETAGLASSFISQRGRRRRMIKVPEWR